MNKKNFTVFFLVSQFFLLTLFSCKNNEPIIIWTDRPEVVSYVEFFNVAQNKAKAVVIYKEKLAVSLPPAKDEKSPDIVIGSFLKNSRIKKNFSSINRVFSRHGINPSEIYAPLLEYGKSGGRQYLIPVSFNLPTMIFSHKDDGLLIDSDEIRDLAANFNQKSEEGIFVKMGFAPSWNPDFVFQNAKMNGAKFDEKGNAFSWNQENLEKTIEYFKDWTLEKNGGTSVEQDFSFKYLYAPPHKIVSLNRCLFAYIKSDLFFDIPIEQSEYLSFRWLSKNEKVYVDDGLTSLGVYRKTKNASASYDFIIWFLSESTQKNLLDRAMRMKLDTQSFGICGGFSSLKGVNENVFPSYYKNLLGKMPSENSLVPPSALPPRWESLKEKVIIPYLLDSTNTDSLASVKSIDERISVWKNQFN